jgi:sterol desaturase/sphingolipid hydroxylase (fatty acid hydroxylase superfamily)
MQEVLYSFGEKAVGLIHLITFNESRLFWGYLLATAGIVFIVWFTNDAIGTVSHLVGNDDGSQPGDARGSQGGRRTFGDFLRFLLPVQVYGHHSFRLDVKLMLFANLAVPGGWFIEGWALAWLASHVSGAAHTLFGIGALESAPSFAAKLSLGVLLFVASDFARFFNHYLHHKIPALWELHSVHHSAEHLNPLTTYRFHPIEILFENLSVVVFVGTLAGVAESLMGGSPLTYYGTIYAWTYLRAANVLGNNIRHMHVWWAWNVKLSHVLNSPAQHQIHHSVDVKHHDKNFGLFLSVWDWMFGTLYVPREKETLAFGLGDGATYTTLVGALINPVVRVANSAIRPERAATAP